MFVKVILPIFLVISCGYLIGKLRNVETKSIAAANIYVLLPSLVFVSLIDSVGFSISKIVIYVTIFTILLWILTGTFLKFRNFDSKKNSAFLLSTLFMNSGNYGIPFCLFAFGDEGLKRAVIFATMGSVMMYTAAVYIASRSERNIFDASKSIFKLPLIYAVIFAVIVNRFGIVVPEVLLKPLSLLADAAIPMNMLILGIQLSHTSITSDLKDILFSNGFRLLLSPFLALLIIKFMGVDDVTRNVLLAESSMPTAINAALIAIEFNSKPDFVSCAILTSTLMSMVTLTVLLWFVG